MNPAPTLPAQRMRRPLRATRPVRGGGVEVVPGGQGGPLDFVRDVIDAPAGAVFCNPLTAPARQSLTDFMQQNTAWLTPVQTLLSGGNPLLLPVAPAFSILWLTVDAAASCSLTEALRREACRGAFWCTAHASAGTVGAALLTLGIISAPAAAVFAAYAALNAAAAVIANAACQGRVPSLSEFQSMAAHLTSAAGHLQNADPDALALLMEELGPYTGAMMEIRDRGEDAEKLWGSFIASQPPPLASTAGAPPSSRPRGGASRYLGGLGQTSRYVGGSAPRAPQAPAQAASGGVASTAIKGGALYFALKVLSGGRV